MGQPRPLGLANEPPAVRPNLEVVVKELDRFLVNVLHDDDLLALIAVPPLIVELRVVTLGSQHLAGKVALADSWSAPNPDSAHICLVDEFEILAVNALQIAQVLDLNFGGNFRELALGGELVPSLPVLGLCLA